MYKLNLQMFADEELLEDEGLLSEHNEIEEELPFEPVEDELEEEEDYQDLDEGDEEDLDKKTRALIKYKKEAAKAKREKEELEERLEALELEKEKEKRVAELTRQGKDSTEANQIAEGEAEEKTFRLQLMKLELEKLESRYPGIRSYAKDLAKDKAKYPDFTLEQIYLARYSKRTNYDNRTQMEQELAYKNREARNKSLEPSNKKTPSQVKLTPEDERAFRYLKGTMPGLTRKRFKELQGSDSLE